MGLHDYDFRIPITDPETGLASEAFKQWVFVNKRDKANRVEDGTENNIATLDENGHPQDSSSSITDVSSIVENFAELESTKILASDGDGNLQEVDLDDWVAGTEGKITVTDDSDGTITLNISLKSNSGLTFDVNGIYPLLRSGYGITVDANGLQLKKQSNETDASESHTITDPGDAPVDADALRDDLVTNTIPSIETALNNMGVKVNAILALLLAAEIMAGP